MDSDGKSICNNDMWEWQEEDYHLNEITKNDLSRCLWDEVNQSEDSLIYLLEEQTPIKDCSDFGYQTADIEENMNKLLEECRDSSQQKRRRVLCFPHDTNEISICNVQRTSVFLKSKERENEQMHDEEPSSSVNVEWSSQRDTGLSDGSCAFNSEAWDQASEGWLDDCLDSSMMQCKIDETTAPMQDLNCDEASNQEVHITKRNNLPSGMHPDSIQVSQSSPLPKLLKGRRFIIGSSTKSTSSVAYPFALIKPCGSEGNLTLKDINQRLHNPLPTRTKNEEDEKSSLSFPTSAFSGKPVVLKTKIRTEGGKGSITIMRTKG
ncbi:protein XRI1-like [Phalaenopsis equestris]|uniref:protein XRI1-like n=1 Tax=Phalaenopsis equestris TaxID=78828 RepID=UPI0009E26B5B|nr:protein XRI1-like [Phalaenopsis equestris]